MTRLPQLLKMQPLNGDETPEQEPLCRRAAD